MAKRRKNPAPTPGRRPAVKPEPFDIRKYVYPTGDNPSGHPEWTAWTVARAVKDGMKVNPWVFKAIRMITQRAVTVPLAVVVDGAFDYEHPISKHLANPNPSLSSRDIYELLYSWLQLAGTAYILKTNNNGQPSADLMSAWWPLSPDRVAPVRDPRADNDFVIVGYAAAINGQENKVKWAPDEVLAFIHADPSKPLQGLSPLMAEAKSVDADNAARDWNKNALDNQGGVDGFIAFDTPLAQDQADMIRERIDEKFSGAKNARKIGVLGGNAKWIEVRKSGLEFAFSESSKATRDEILGVFGVPPQLAGATEASTYNNFATAELVFWRTTLLPFLEDFCASLTFHFRDALGGLEIKPDTSGVKALTQDLTPRIEAAERLFRMGVPLAAINETLELGLPDDIPNADKPFAGAAVGINPATGNIVAGGGADPQPAVEESMPSEGATRGRLLLRQDRDLEGEFRRVETIAEGWAHDTINPLLDAQRSAVIRALEDEGTALAVNQALTATRTAWLETFARDLPTIAGQFADTVVLSTRASGVLLDAITAYLASEAVVLREVSMIEAATVRAVLEQVRAGLEAGASVSDIAQAIDDIGSFSPERALRIARTVTAGARSVGQVVAASEAGATVKVWSASIFHTRDLHMARDGEEAPIDGAFTRVMSPNGAYPRYPGDPDLAAEDRINCRCVLTFSAPSGV